MTRIGVTMKKPLWLLTMLFFTPLTAQIINVKTYPVLSDENMFSFPSRYQAMGNTDISVSDDVKNLFVNPAALVSVKRVAIFFLPRRSSWSYERESNTSTNPDHRSRSLNRMGASNFTSQVSAVSSSGNFALSSVINYQRMTSSDLEEFTYTGGAPPVDESTFGATNFPVQIGAAVNVPLLAMSFGAQYSFVSVNGIDGIQFLYPNSKRISVKGKSSDSRLGVIGDLFGLGSFEALAGIAQFATTQTAYFESQSPVTNKDENNTKYFKLNYRFSLSDRVRVGLKGVINWKELPQLPNYPIAGILRDPGTITAYNLGTG